MIELRSEQTENELHEKKLMRADKKPNAVWERDPMISDAVLNNVMLPHEFLYLMANADERQEILRSVKRLKLSINKIQIDECQKGLEMFAELNLDKIYQFDEDSRKILQNPKFLM
jgi:hypothetical protein